MCFPLTWVFKGAGIQFSVCEKATLKSCFKFMETRTVSRSETNLTQSLKESRSDATPHLS